eukprot:TRINITY_DN3539_c0_g1_i2.p1 TRINITY_DN3539_c0_g1~~TRINITY_DN3539_c0_g1_i2.p1  ORF type:complete len:412 (-),score=90.64 TRINITY_DN3539_c0_g1_i2:63-1298(-)
MGNDSTATGSMGSPYGTFNKALSVMEGIGPGQPTILCVLPGEITMNAPTDPRGPFRHLQILPVDINNPPVLVKVELFIVDSHVEIGNFNINYLNLVSMNTSFNVHDIHALQTGTIEFDDSTNNNINQITFQSIYQVSIQLTSLSAKPTGLVLIDQSELLEVNVDALEFTMTNTVLYSFVSIQSPTVTITNCIASHLNLEITSPILTNSFLVLYPPEGQIPNFTITSNTFSNITLNATSNSSFVLINIIGDAYHLTMQNNTFSCNIGTDMQVLPVLPESLFNDEVLFVIQNNTMDPQCPYLCAPGKEPSYQDLLCKACPATLGSPGGLAPCIPCTTSQYDKEGVCYPCKSSGEDSDCPTCSSFFYEYPDCKKMSKKGRAVLGGVFGGVGLLVLVGIVIWMYQKRRETYTVLQ